MSDWKANLEWHLADAKRQAIVNDAKAAARKKKKDEERKKAIEAGLDIPPLEISLPNTISQTTARKMEKHELDLGDICHVRSGKYADKKVIVIKAGVQTKFGLKSITVEYFGEHKTGEKVWVSPELLTFEGESDMDTANAIKEADYQEWKARKQAGVPPASSFKQKTWGKRKESGADPDDSFLG